MKTYIDNPLSFQYFWSLIPDDVPHVEVLDQYEDFIAIHKSVYIDYLNACIGSSLV